MLSARERAFVERHRVARLATADKAAAPHLVPVCFVLDGACVFITIDGKPKTASGRAVKRIRNIVENPAVALLVDRYDEDWTRLGWVMLRGQARILDDGNEHDRAQALLRARYPQLGGMRIERQPVFAIGIARVTSWGNLD